MATTSEGTVKIVIKAEDRTGGVFGKVFGQLNRLGRKAALAGAAAVAAAGIAITAVATKGISDFMKFEDQMNEVFTLLPGISGAAMKEMRDQVLETSVEMGRLPEEVIPALYQALSAGVPADNVFEFLETSHKAALGGVTSLETAVDGISSVVNSYGAEIITAAEASDFMFTTVRLGKTNFEELSANLSNVIPLAAGMGISFGDVSAAMATMTAQGTPTAQATVQMRSLLTELGTAGTEVNGIFQELAGESFLEFIDNGGNVAQAMGMLEEHAIATNTPIQDMFGNVRAGLGALQLTGSGLESFNSNLMEMEGSAGATDAAFNTMNTGMARTFEQIKARISTTFIKIGEALEPVVRMLSEKLFAALESLEPVIKGVLGAFTRFFEIMQSGGDPIFALTNLIFSLLRALGVSQGSAAQIAKKFRLFANTIVDDVIPGIKDFIKGVKKIADPIIEAIRGFVSFKDILIAVGAIIGGAILAAIGSLIIALAPVIATVVAVIAIVALLRNAWENDWGGIQEKVRMVIAFIQNLIQTALTFIQEFWATHGETIIAQVTAMWEWIKTTIQTVVEIIWMVIQTVLTAIQEFWASHGEQIIATIITYFEIVRTVVTTVIKIVQTVITTVLNAIKSFWESHGEAIMAKVSAVFAIILNVIQRVITTVQTVITTILTAIRTFWEEHGDAILLKAEQIWDAIKEAIDTVLGIIQTIWEAWGSAFEGDWRGFGEKLREAWDTAWNAIKDFLENMGEIILGVIQDLATKILTFFRETDWLELGKNIIEGLIDGLEAGKDAVIDFIIKIASGALDAIKGFFGIASPSRIMFDVGTSIVEGLISGLKRNLNDVSSVAEQIAEAAFIPSAELAMSARLNGKEGFRSVASSDFSGKQITNNFNMVINTGATEATVAADFDMMRSIAAGF